MIRKVCLVGFCGALGVMLLSCQSSSEAQGKKDTTVQQLQKSLKEKEQQIQKLEAQIQKMKLQDVQQQGQVALLKQRITFLEGDTKKKKGSTGKSTEQLQKDLDKANQTIKDKDQLIATLQQKAPKATTQLSKDVEKLQQTVRELETLKKAPLVHTVILKLKKNDAEQVKTITEEATKTLAKISGVRGLWIGKPAENATPVLAQTGYQLGVVILFDSGESLLSFLEDPLHKQFNEKLADLWERPIVYDIQREIDAPKN